MTDRDGGSAFPRPAPQTVNPGMSLRDWFAGQAMAAVISFVGVPEDEPDALWNGAIAAHCYAIADAMITVREGGSNG